MPDLRRLGLAALLIAGPAPAHTVPAQPPPLTIPRYDEDWSVLADPAIRTGAGTEPLKYNPLTVDAYADLVARTQQAVPAAAQARLGDWRSTPSLKKTASTLIALH